MKKKTVISALLAVILIALSVLPSCSGPAQDPADTSPSGSPETDSPGTEAPKPVFYEADHEIEISEAAGILAANGLRTNIDKWTDTGGAWHGGQQMRAVHTERGTYAAFASDFGDGDELQKYYVAKTDPEGNSSILHYGQFYNDDAEVTVNIGRDTVTGDIIATATSNRIHTVCILDAATDKVTEYSIVPEFKTKNVQKLNYSNVLFDFDRRRVCVLSVTSSKPVGDWVFEWFTFDLEARKWVDGSVAGTVPDIGRHGYNYLFPDGKGGAYIAAERNEYSIYAEGRYSLAGESYIWDRIDLFHIPDMSSAEGITFVPVREEDDSLGLEGIWSNAPINQYGDAYIDASGNIHLTYRFCLVDYAGGHEPFDRKLEYRHDVFDSGMNLIFSEPIELPEDYDLFRFFVRQDTDGTLCMIGATISERNGDGIVLYFYRAQDGLGRTWKLEKTYSVGGEITTDSLSLTGKRDGSVQDGTVACFFYGYERFNSTVYTFDIRLADFSVTPVTDMIEGYGIQIDWRLDKRIPASDSGNQVIRTSDAAYSAFVYNYAHREDTEYFCVLKTPDGGEPAVLYSGSFNSVQDRSLSMSMSDDGIIRVLPPTGNTAVLIDTATDEVTEHTYTIFYPTYEELKPQVNEIVSDGRTGEEYYLTVSRSRYFGMNVRKIDSEKQSVPAKGRILDFDRELAGGYTGIYTFGAEGGRVFIVGTREITQEQTGGKLTYSGRTQSVKDSLMLFVIDDVAESETVRCIEIEAPYEDEGSGGIWSCVKTDDAFLDADGKLNVIYTVWRCDFDDADRRENDGVVADSLRVFRAVFDGDSQISKEELRIDGADRETSLRMIRTSDGTEYIAACNLQNSYPFLRFGIYPEGGEAKVTVYCSTDDGWKPAAEKTLGKYAAEGFALSGPRSGSADSDTVNCIVFTSENDVRILSLAFSEK